ncbi:MAG: class I SAM-dependent methyltransferase [Deltaproteobacteria bacterium]|nr:class I SAM-dependent methyltransferase [Deltaproteobacteria bacterium]
MRVVRQARAAIYDAAIVRLTASWYRAVLQRLPSGCRLLDIGMGTGSALLANAGLLHQRDLYVTGVDIDADYVRRCQAAVRRADLGARVTPRLESIYDHQGGPYGAAYFSASFMLLPDPPAALRHVCGLLAPEARLYFTQTFEHARSPSMERLKPLLRTLTTIDFGKVTYEDDFRRALADGGLTVASIETLHPGRRRSGILAVAQPRR